MAVKSPGSVVWDDGDEDRIERAQLALLLHITPAMVDEMSVQDAEDVLAIYNANREIEAWGARRKR